MLFKPSKCSETGTLSLSNDTLDDVCAWNNTLREHDLLRSAGKRTLFSNSICERCGESTRNARARGKTLTNGVAAHMQGHYR